MSFRGESAKPAQIVGLSPSPGSPNGHILYTCSIVMETKKLTLTLTHGWTFFCPRTQSKGLCGIEFCVFHGLQVVTVSSCSVSITLTSLLSWFSLVTLFWGKRWYFSGRTLFYQSCPYTDTRHMNPKLSQVLILNFIFHEIK